MVLYMQNKYQAMLGFKARRWLAARIHPLYESRAFVGTEINASYGLHISCTQRRKVSEGTSTSGWVLRSNSGPRKSGIPSVCCASCFRKTRTLHPRLAIGNLVVLVMRQKLFPNDDVCGEKISNIKRTLWNSSTTYRNHGIGVPQNRLGQDEHAPCIGSLLGSLILTAGNISRRDLE